MESIKERDEFANILLLMLKKITESPTRVLDTTYLEKLLSNVKLEIDTNHEEPFIEIIEWLAKILQSWRKSCPTLTILEFICEFVGTLVKIEQRFMLVQRTNAINDLSDILQQFAFTHNSTSLMYIKLLTDVLNHSAGLEWIKTTYQWKVVIKMCFLNSNFYVKREGLKFTKIFCSRINLDDNVMQEVLEEILLPISKQKEIVLKEKQFYSKVHLSLRLLEEVLRAFTVSVQSNAIWLQLQKIFDLEAFLKFILQNCDQDDILDSASSIYVTFLIVKCKNKQQLLSTQQIPFSVLEIFNTLLSRNQTRSIIKLAKFCQILWNEMRNVYEFDNLVGIHFIVLQLVPVLTYHKKPPDTKLFDLFIQKLFDLTSKTTQKFGYSLRNAIRNEINSNPRDWAIKGILSVTGNIENLNHEEAVVIFQAIAYVLKVSEDCCEDPMTDVGSLEKQMLPCHIDASLLSTVLNAMSVLIERFKINWTECLESLCLLKMTCNLLQNIHLSSRLVVQTLLLVKLAIMNFMSPNLALLLNKTEDYSFECLMPLLYKRMHDPSWEVRDSCIEVVTVIAELAESKYPAFQQLLEEKKFCSLVYSIMEGDSESYVRASALQALSAMTKIEPLNQCLNNLNFASKIIEILQNESEGIVRREAALLVRQIYLNQNEPSSLQEKLYEVMGYTATCDLHWEVKVNSLLFWETVIHQMIADQGMIDGSFPKVTFSKEHKKIVTLTNEEIKLRLHKVLQELSNVGCLHVLLSTLNDDCDFPVVQKSAQILTDFVAILRRYDVIKSPVRDRVPMKRKSNGLTNCEKRKPPNSMVDDSSLNDSSSISKTEKKINSDEIIEEIVNEMDINLLVSVCYPKEKGSVKEKKMSMKEVKPEAFVLQMQDFDFRRFLDEKHRWLASVDIDLKSFVNDIVKTDDLVYETNIMDCY